MNVFELFATLSLDTSGYDEALENSEEKGSSFASKLGSGFKKAGGTVLKATAAGFVAAGAGVATLTKQSVQAYGEYEQLAGGIEKLFGDSSDTVMNYANEAYMSAGLSANQYMETVTGFSASLIQGLEGDTEAAAQLSDLAIRDMSDNVNVYGSDMESVMSAYQGFAKQNWTLLDNLKLGYGGTQEEMVRLINDSGILNEEISSMDGITFDQVIEAIHTIQEETGIAGTTANEASTTLQGSLSSFQASWQNMLTGLADPSANLSSMIDNVITTGETLLGNLVPIISRALSGIGEAITRIVPIVTAELPNIINSLLPPLITAAGQLIVGVVQALPSLIQVLAQTLPELIKTTLPAILEVIPDLIDSALLLISALAEGIGQALPVLIPAVIQIVLLIIEKLTEPDTMMLLTNATVQLFGGIILGIAQAIPSIVEMIPTLISNLIQTLVQSFPALVASLIGLLDGLGSDVAVNLQTKMTEHYEAVTTALSNIVSAIKEKLGDAVTAVTTKLNSIKTKFTSIFNSVKTTVSNAITAVKNAFDFEWSLPDLKLPHISVTGGEAPWGIGGKGSLPTFDIEWYRKAYDDAYMLNNPTIFGFSGGTLLGGGEGNGGEMVMGEEYFQDTMLKAASRITIQPVVTVYVAGEEMDSYTVSAEKRIALVDGGRG